MRDPRSPALLFAGLCVCIGVAALGRDDPQLYVPATVFALLVLTAMTLAALPPWRGTRSGPRLGAITASLAGLSILAVALVLASA